MGTRSDTRVTEKASSSRPRPDQLVVVGASAGGIEALSILVGHLDAQFPAPILVAQHLDPRRLSHLGEILGRASSLPVVTVDDRSPLEPGYVYVVPANQHVRVTDHEVRLTEGTSRGSPVPSVDLALSSAAEVFGESTIAVILTGTGTDGAAGARRVKAVGGTVVAQDPKTARFASMPAALGPIVDVVAEIEEIGGVLNSLVRGQGEPQKPDEERLFKTFLDQLRERSGIDFASYKRATILRRIQRRMVATGNRRLREYVAFLGTHPDEYAKLTSSLLIKVTEFFRDPELFEHLRTVTLPPIIDEARRRGRDLRLWSAGCATGEEAYSLAILVASVLGDELNEWTVRVFATDVDNDAITFARRAIYPSSMLESVPTDIMARHFTRHDGEYEVGKHIRAMTIFGQHDLAMRAPFPRIDVALCRNVLIYFTPELQRRALQLFAFALRDGGALILGKAETTSPLAEYFEPEDQRLKVYRRRGERLLIPPMRLPTTTSLLPPRTHSRRTFAGESAEPGAGRGRSGAAERAEAMLALLPVGIVIVDASYDVAVINPVARRLLGIHGGALGQDLMHLMRDVGAADMRAGLDAALDGTVMSTTVEIAAPAGGEAPRRLVRLDFAPQTGPDASRMVTVLVRDVTAEGEDLRTAEATAQTLRLEVARLQRQLADQAEANRRILADNDELARTNIELRSSNEELLVANEEVQAATEEVETLNEELQSTNEELETLNEELQATVEELNTTNDDVEARTAELQQLAGSLEMHQRQTEAERARLASALESLPDAVLVLDQEGQEVLRTAEWQRLFDGASFRSPGNGGTAVSEEDLRKRARRADAFDLELERSDAASRYHAAGRPLASGYGFVVAIRDTAVPTRRSRKRPESGR